MSPSLSSGTVRRGRCACRRLTPGPGRAKAPPARRRSGRAAVLAEVATVVLPRPGGCGRRGRPHRRRRSGDRRRRGPARATACGATTTAPGSGGVARTGAPGGHGTGAAATSMIDGASRMSAADRGACALRVLPTTRTVLWRSLRRARPATPAAPPGVSSTRASPGERSAVAAEAGGAAAGVAAGSGGGAASVPAAAWSSCTAFRRPLAVPCVACPPACASSCDATAGPDGRRRRGCRAAQSRVTSSASRSQRPAPRPRRRCRGATGR